MEPWLHMTPNHISESRSLAGPIIRAFTFLHCVIGLHIFVSVSYCCHVAVSRILGFTKFDAPTTIIWVLFVIHILTGHGVFPQFLDHTDKLHTFNSIDNFYDPASCGEARPLKSGILLKAELGEMYP